MLVSTVCLKRQSCIVLYQQSIPVDNAGMLFFFFFFFIFWGGGLFCLYFREERRGELYSLYAVSIF